MKFGIPKQDNTRWGRASTKGYGPSKRSAYMQSTAKPVYPRGTGKAVSGYKFKGVV